ALSGNYLRVYLSSDREPNRIVDVRVGALAEDGLREQSGAVFPVLP
ncbi:MAG: hypothetical protein IT158_02075, partial [Bryobacterales bacterium]|nr:hypothetical protein [Bryobacterales bacterium]